MPSARYLLAQSAYQLMQEGSEPGEDFSASEGQLLCTQAARACLLKQVPAPTLENEGILNFVQYHTKKLAPQGILELYRHSLPI